MRHESATLARFENKQQMRSGEKNAPKKRFQVSAKKSQLAERGEICFNMFSRKLFYWRINFFLT
jgi:hypothetical protein